jgi:hypothetical protein
MEFIHISVPALVTLIIGPTTVLFHHSTLEFFWTLEEYPTIPNIIDLSRKTKML